MECLSQQLTDTTKKRAQLNGECCEVLCLTVNTMSVIFWPIDELKMMKRMAKAEDLELDKIQSRVKTSKGESV